LFIFVILGTTFIDFHLVQLMYNAQKPALRKLLLVLSVGMNLGLLFYFKYAFFVIENINYLLHLSGNRHIVWEKVALPIGISFFTFESLTYVVDVYRNVHAPLKKFWNYQLYIILFPKLIAGPIVRYHDIADQITNRFGKENAERFLSGLYRFIIGLSKKVLIANTLGEFADKAFQSNIAHLGTGTAWLGIVCYTFQIYFDFSGYSDMAIGLLKIMAFDISENFNQPYSAVSITDFWHRWHISLSTWMRNYLYIPLGGNRVNSKWRLYFNLWLVFLASGLWHGASWNFVIWGAYHGLWLVCERAFLLKIYARLWRPLQTAIVFFIVVIGWVFFRSEKLAGALAYLHQLFTWQPAEMPLIKPDLIFFLVVAALFSFLDVTETGNRLIQAFYSKPYSNKAAAFWGVVCVALIICDVGSLAITGFNPFIYFRF
jgi:alginate O-acetyltransferase complex protein AlgI